MLKSVLPSKAPSMWLLPVQSTLSKPQFLYDSGVPNGEGDDSVKKHSFGTYSYFLPRVSAISDSSVAVEGHSESRGQRPTVLAQAL